MKKINEYLKSFRSFLGSIVFDDADGLRMNNVNSQIKCEQPFYILKYPVSLNQWKTLMPYDNHHNFRQTFSWNEMHLFIQKVSNRLSVRLQLPTPEEWEYACSNLSELSCRVHEAEIVFWIYNRPYGTMVDERFPHMRKFELCKGAENISPNLLLSGGLGHETIALYLITYDDCRHLQQNEIFNANDFYYIPKN